MKIGMVCPYSLSTWGAVQLQAIAMSKVLLERGIDVTLMAPCDGSRPEPWVVPLGASIPLSQNGSLAPIAPDIPAQRRLLEALKSHRFDVLHLHEPLVPGPTITALIKKSAPIIATFHASGNIPAYRWTRPLASRLARRIDVRVAVSSEAVGTAMRYLGGDYEQISNGVRVNELAAAPTPRDRSILFLGRHEPRKGLEVLLEASQMMPTDVRVRIAGAGPETARLRRRFGQDQRVEWLGPLSEQEKCDWLESSGTLCVPSLGGESFGVVLIEGMAAGIPIVASDLTAYRLVTRDGLDAALFPTGDSAALAKQLLESLDGGIPVEDRRVRALDRASHFSIERTASAYQRLYASVIART